MEVIQLNKIKILRHVNSFYESNTYLIVLPSSNNCWLVDCGDIDEITEYIVQHRLRLLGVFLTHTHYDHIYGLNRLTSIFKDVQIFTNEFGSEALYSPKLNLSKYHNSAFILNSQKIVLLKAKESIVLDESFCIDVFSVPGHDKSSLMYHINNNYFTGDSYIPNFKVVTLFPNSDKCEARKSIRLIEQLIVHSNVFAGHGRVYLKYTACL